MLKTFCIYGLRKKHFALCDAAFLAAVVAILMACSSARAQLVEVAFDDFEGLTLNEFTAASGAGDGTDWTDQIRTGTDREWVIDNSLMTGTTTELAYVGWTAMDIDSWIDEQGVQAGRGDTDNPGPAFFEPGAGSNNTILVVDPDAWDDYTSAADENGFTSFITRAYDLVDFDESTTTISFDYHFVSEDNQMGNVEVSFDDGVTWQTLIAFDSTAVSNGTVFSSVTGQNTFVAGADFNATSNSLLLKFGCFDSGNDWWFAVDNVSVTTTDGFNDLEDFEGLVLVPFTEAGQIGDGTDWLREIPNWTVDNSGNLGGCFEAAFDGWSAMDAASWVEEQGGQGRTLFNIVDPNNTILVADGDAFYDYDFDFDDPTQGAVSPGLNTYISRTYDVSGFDNCTLRFSYEYEFRVENQQLGVVEVSFDGGQTWERFETYAQTVDADGNNNNNDVLSGFLEAAAGTNFSPQQTNTVTFRFGYLDAGNNWWFAIDNVALEAEAITFVKGDADGDGVANTLDIAPFVSILIGTTTSSDPALDFNCDGAINTLDISGFVNVLLGN